MPAHIGNNMDTRSNLHPLETVLIITFFGPDVNALGTRKAIPGDLVIGRKLYEFLMKKMEKP